MCLYKSSSHQQESSRDTLSLQEGTVPGEGLPGSGQSPMPGKGASRLQAPNGSPRFLLYFLVADWALLTEGKDKFN